MSGARPGSGGLRTRRRSDDLGRDIIRIEGSAIHVQDHSRADEVADYAAKYTERIGAIFGTVEQFAASFSEAIVVTPHRLHA